MKNFRKSIIALATAAAMLIPSVAMAATLTTTVDKDIDGDVYVGFYDGAVLKDVVKTTVANATVTDAAAAEDLAASVVVTDEIADLASESEPDAEIHKLVFKATIADEDTIEVVNMVMSYDAEVVIPVALDGYDLDIADWDDFDEAYRPYTLCSALTYDTKKGTWKALEATAVETDIATIDNRVGLYLTQKFDKPVKMEDSVVMEFYYRVADGQAVGKDTFKIETDVTPGSFQDLIGDNGKEVGFKLSGYLYNNAETDTLAFSDFPWNLVQEPTTKTLSVDVPEGAEGYTPTMFIWDADQIAQCAPITTFTKN